MKHINYKIYLAASIIGACFFTSCNEEKEITSKSQKVYLGLGVYPHNIVQWSVEQTPINATCNESEFKFPVRMTIPALKSDITVTVETDNAAVEAYNKSNNTSYEIANPEAYEFVQNTVTIKGGSNESTDLICLKIKDFKLLNSENGHLIPIIITHASGGVSISSNMNIMYLSLTNSWNYIEGVTTSIDGGALCNSRADWSCAISRVIGNDTTDGTLGSLAGAFDGNFSTFWYGYTGNDSPVTFTIDFKRNVNMKGIYMTPYYLSLIHI